MRRGPVAGAIAGAVGTIALEGASYADMYGQGRPASALPARAAAQLAERLGIDLGPPDDDATDSRAAALGALLGYGLGVGAGAAFGLLTRRWRRTSVRAALGLGAAVMVAADGPLIAQGLTDPRTWGVKGWLSDIVPHAVYGLTAATVLDLVTRSG